MGRAFAAGDPAAQPSVPPPTRDGSFSSLELAQPMWMRRTAEAGTEAPAEAASQRAIAHSGAPVVGENQVTFPAD